MIMKKILLLFPLFSLAITLPSQSFPGQLFVASTALKLRQEPSRDSKVLATMANGEAVQVEKTNPNENNRYYYQIDSLNGYWIKVRYKDKSGYAFSAYLASRYNLYYEFNPVQYLPKLNNWYGMYKKPNGEEEIRAIKVETRTVSDPETGHSHKVLYTDQKDTSLFIIGTNEVIRSGYAGVFSRNFAHNSGIELRIKPGVECSLYTRVKGNSIQGECYHLFGTGTYEISEYGMQLANFKIWVAKNNPPDPKYNIIQDLSPCFSLMKTEGLVNVEWVGDLDRDGKPDAILQCCSTQQCTNILFLSSEAGTNELLAPVSSYSWYDEC